MKKILLLLGLAIVLLGGGFGFDYYKRASDYKHAVQAIRVTEPNLTTIKDGEYTGEHDVGFIRAKVKVEVKDHRFRAINLIEHANDRGGKADRLPQDMLAQQKVTVDAISGATNSSKVIQKAVENALKDK